jgi:Tfp pilus assembly protein FimT
MTTQPPKHASGFSLAELCFTLAIMAVIYQTCLPNVKALLDYYAHQRVIHTIRSTITWAQNKSWQRNQTLKLCPMKNNLCVADWTLPIQVYATSHQNPSHPQTLKIFQWPEPSVQINWQRKLPMTFHPRGWVSNSHFQLRSKYFKNNVIVSAQGKTRVVTAKL